ncbi:MAG: type 4a pilus biogenesis protein PilO [Candidatus Omnitrophota bacterium]
MDTSEWIFKNKNKIINILFVALFLFIAGKIYGKQLEAMNLLVEKKDLELKKNVILDGISGTEKKIAAYRKLLGEKDGSSVINTIGTIAGQTGVKIISVKPTKLEKYLEYVKFPYKLQLSAESYHSLGRFFSRLESHADIFMVDAVEIGLEERSNNLKAVLTVSLVSNK